ncbi:MULTISPECIES: hypothetical protein [Amycolatopsis]|uniref:Uncharacterized protein n=1 Tax=Amycolatopsis viridis TaxID=185678 RepID=A0ABX0T262_9PSEU|nr:hypothetical protein [Amycolatopsis viridis]NIH81635.1 hypothetical protein [Amycolatopsis viridis]NIH84668.1 hypothetical protein [Amycolatopsis granulosa]
MFDGLATWWDNAELWLAQRWFPLQFLLVIVVLAPLCVGAAWLIDRIVDRVAAWLRPGRGEDVSSRS